jgi:hypothetical protein
VTLRIPLTSTSKTTSRTASPAFIAGCLLSACALRDKEEVKTYNRSKSKLSKRGIVLTVDTLTLEDGELDSLLVVGDLERVSNVAFFRGWRAGEVELQS